MNKDAKNGLCLLKLRKIEKSTNSNEENEDYTIKKATFSILTVDEVSGNGQVVTEEECEKAKHTLINKPLLCTYLKDLDDFSDHEEIEVECRNSEDETYLSSETYAIGVCTDAYIDSVVDEDGTEKKMLLADFTLWVDRYYNEISLMFDYFYNYSEDLYSSCEYMYTDSDVINGVEYPKNINFVGHTMLGSKENKVEPSYKSSKLKSINEKVKSSNKVWNSVMREIHEKLNNNKSNNKEDKSIMKENIFRKALNSISFGDIRDEIMDVLSELMTAKEYQYVWIGVYDVHAEYFYYETYNEESQKWETFKVPYSMDSEDKVSVDLESKEKVEYQLVAVSQNSLDDAEKSLNEANAKIEELEKANKESNSKIEESNNKIDELNETIIELNGKLAEKSENAKEAENEVNETIKSLNAKIEEMQPIVEQFKAQEFEKALNSAKVEFEKKFKQVNALDVYEEEATQELIKQYASSDVEVSKNAKSELNSLIVENINISNNSAEENEDSDDIMKDNTRISINSVKKTDDIGEILPKSEDSIYAEKYGIDYK